MNKFKTILEDVEIIVGVKKHGSHNQKTHGNWATGGEIAHWNPNDPVPASPRNAGGMTDKIWENWEHGVDGEQYVELYRQYAAEALGLKVPESDMAPGGSLNYLTQRGFGGSSTQTAKGHALAILKAIANGSPTQPALYRGVTELKNDPNSTALVQQLSSLKAGDTLDMPLVSTTRSLGVAAWYAADRVQSGSSPIIMKIQAGAKGVSIAPEKSYYQADHEVITSGKFEVVSVNQVKTPYWKRGIFEPRKTVYTDGSGTSYEVATYSPKRYTSAEAKNIWNTVSAGKLQSLATSKFKLTDDRSKNPNRTVYSSWDLQAPTEFTIVEVKMIEPHVVQKSIDHGMKFDSLFAGRPQYDAAPLEKHGNHDQSSHGNWATGELSEEQKSVVSAWTSLSNKTSWREIANDLSEGKTPNASEDDIKTVKTLVDAIKQNGVIPAEALGRAELLTTGLRWQGALPKVGDTLKNELSSATLDERTSERFSQYSDFGGSKGKPVIFHYGFQTKGLDVNRAGADNFADEQEWLVSGTFKITERYSENGITHINLKLVDEVKKHGSHDQKTHGSWANGGSGKTVTGLINKLSEKRSPGFSIDLRTGASPKDGFIASDMGAEEAMPWKEASKTRDNLRNVMVNYMDKHAELLDGSGAFFGGWVDEGTLFLDVSRRYPTRSEGVAAGFANQQKAIYDVVNDSYIYMKDEVDGRTNKARNDRSTEGNQGYDQGRETSLRGQNNRRNDGQPLTFPHVCLGRYQVQKHLEGQHDQGTHGNWAGDRYPTDSVKSARDGAKEYAFKKGLEPDETIDYTKVVANRERASKIADVYEDLPKMDRDAVDEYEALASEVEQQFDFMTKNLGVKVSFVAEDPYKTSKEMFDDVSKGNLKVLSTASTGAHPLFSNEQNDKFRAVHDYFGHAATGRGFGQDGEEAAWVHHSQMFTMDARAALTTETRGQNSFFNNRGKQFADQKVALLPSEFWEVPAVFTKFRAIRFAFGLKPIFKHSGGEAHAGGDDQSSHGNWARGISAEDEALINEMENLGPSLQDLENALTPAEQPDYTDLKDYVNNDAGMYEAAIEGIDERVAERLKNLQEEFPNHEYTEQEKTTIYEDMQNEMIQEYIDNDDGTIAQLWQEQNGEEFNPEDLHTFFDDVYAMDYDVKNAQGEVATTLSSSTNNIYLDGQRLVVTGEITDDAGNYAGEFQRGFFKSQDKQGNEIWAVEHDLFKMEDEYAGVGFGSKFIARQEAWYVAVGIGRIDVGTAWDGARHWAKSGFDFDERNMRENVSQLIGGRINNSADFGEGSTNRLEFDSLMSKMVTDYTPIFRVFTSFKPITSEDFPIPNDFLMIGYKDRVQIDTNRITGKPVYSWAGARLLNNLTMKYQKGLTKEGRTIQQGPIDRDGDGLVYDGTPREKPAPTVNSSP